MASPRSVSPPADTESEATMMTATTGRTFVELYKPSKHEASSRSFFTRKLASLFYVLGLLVCGLTVAGMGCAHGALLVTIWLDRVYRTYYRPLVNDWNERPITTFRACSSRDLSTDNVEDLILNAPSNDSNNVTPGKSGAAATAIKSKQQRRQQAAYVDHMMVHGMAVIPKVWSASIAAPLREYILNRNDNLTSETEIRINPNYRRKAFAIDPVEDPIVQAAVDALVTNPVLKALVAGLTGDADPALMEMTAITSYSGAAIQNWHHDVLPDRGSAVQYARNYSHSYSIFVALQDTDSSMGATRVCPGTHLCGEDQSDMCAVHGFQPLRPKENDGDQTPVWKQGDAVIFNQQMAHHGEGHASGPDRVMFVASFTNRPRLALDSRVLSAGLFSFSLWNIWGLTWKDLYQNATYTGNPLYRKLRSLGLWKPADANWGLDFITKSVMEWNMGENGMEPDTLERYARRIHSYLGLPTFLQGRVIEVDEDAEEDLEEDPYHTFFDTTIQTWSDFFIKANMALALVFLMVYSALSSCFFQRIPKQPLILITTLIYIVPTIALFWQLRLVEKSEWGQNILNGITFREPFPPARDFSMLYRETSANMGPTTIPERTDVLIGTRLSSPVLGSMRQWLDYHPGNVVYRSALSTTAKVFRSYSGLPFAFQNAVIEQVIDATHGRMLIQDWQTGYWQVLDEIARHRRTVDNVVATGNKMLSVVSLAIDELMAHFRFEVPFRESALAYQTQVMLIQWKKMLYSMELNQVSKKNAKQMYFQHAKEQERLSAETNTSSLPYAVTRTTQVLPQAAPKLFRSKRTPQAAFRIGDTVMTEENRGLSRATILDIRHTGNGALVFDIGYERGEDEDDTPMHELRPIEPMLSGMEIRCRRNGVVSDAIIHVVKPDFSMDVKFQSDGAIYEDMHECFMKPKI